MPYIPESDREKLNPAVDDLIQRIIEAAGDEPMNRAGLLNYSVTVMVDRLVPERRYRWLALFHGVLHDIAAEYYRRRVAPYEEKMIKINGDVYLP